jgi:hypothetical protein
VSEARTGIDGFADDLVRQRRHVGRRVPAYERVLDLVAAELDGELGRRLTKSWARRGFPVYYERPLLLLATLRYDALVTGPSHPLWSALAAEVPDPDAVTRDALLAAFARDRPRVWHSLTRRRVQTNEVSRAVAWLWPAALAGDQPLVLCDMGCSAGLNLVADALGQTWGEVGGDTLAVARDPRVVARLGFDGAPIDATDPDAADWLRACVWVGETARLRRLDAALTALRAAAGGGAGPLIETIDARDMPGRLTSLSDAAHPDALWLAYQTFVREYMGGSRAAYLDGMRAWLRARPPGTALWIEMEDPPDGATRELPAGLMAHVVGADGELADLLLARCYYHPTELAPEPAGVAALRAALARA